MQATFTNSLGFPVGMSTSRAEAQQDELLSGEEYRERLRELPPSAKLVAKVLEDATPLSQGQLAEETLLPDRTVRYALNRLEKPGIGGSRYSFEDARKQVYYLNT